MGFFSKDKLAEKKLADPKKVFESLLKTASGAGYQREIKYNIFYRIIGFKGATTGVGCSTIVANTALALADLGITVCVFDTSIQHPVQDALLRTNYKSKEREDRKDWFDLPYSDESVLNVSGLNNKVSVLSFNGKYRTVLDMMSTKDSSGLVDDAVEKVKDKFDIILIDLCDELTRVNIFSLQKAQHIIQVWDDSLSSLESIESTITNLVTLSCPMDKMRFVVENKVLDDNMGSLDSILKQYRFKKLAHCELSYEIARQVALGRGLWQLPTNDESIIQFTMCIVDIVKHICNIHDDEEETGSITAQDIEDGKVAGTVHSKMLKKQQEMEMVIQNPTDLGKPEVTGVSGSKKPVGKKPDGKTFDKGFVPPTKPNVPSGAKKAPVQNNGKPPVPSGKPQGSTVKPSILGSKPQGTVSKPPVQGSRPQGTGRPPVSAKQTDGVSKKPQGAVKQRPQVASPKNKAASIADEMAQMSVRQPKDHQ